MKKLIVYSSLMMAFMIGTGSIAKAQTTTTTKTETKTKKGWSKRAKGAAIGGGAGAIAGGLIGKGAKGAIVGGALGAGAGYVIGNESDKNKSRAPRKKVYKKTVTTTKKD